MIKVAIDLKETSQAIVREDVVNAYTKGPFYVLYRQTGQVEKWPMANIWRVVEDYGVSASRVEPQPDPDPAPVNDHCSGCWGQEEGLCCLDRAKMTTTELQAEDMLASGFRVGSPKNPPICSADGCYRHKSCGLGCRDRGNLD